MTNYSHKPDFSAWTPLPPPPPAAPPPPSGLRRRVWGGLFWMALVPLLFHSLLPSLSPTAGDGEAVDTLDIRQMELEFQARLLIAARDMAPTGADGADSANRTRMADGSALAPFLESGEPEMLRRTLVVAGHVGLRDLVRQAEEGLTVLSAEGADAHQEVHAQLAALYLADPPEALDEALAARLVEQYGWVGRLLEADQTALTDPDRGAELKGAIGAESRRALIRVGAVSLAVLALFIIGVVALVLFVRRLATGRLSMPGPGGALAPQTAFEAFTFYLVVSALLLVLSEASDDLSALVSAVALVWMAGSPILVLWPMLMGESRRATLEAVGLYGAGQVAREVVTGVVGYAAMIPCLLIASVVSSLVAQALGQSLAEGAHPLAPMLLQSPSAAQIFFMVLLAVVIAPITEEIFFRGFLYYWLRSWAGAPLAIGASALLFAILHPQGIIGVPLLFTLGAGFAVLREWRGSLVAPVVAHACVNGVTTAILLAL